MATPHDLYIRFLVTKGVDCFIDAGRELATLGLKGTTEKDFDKQYNIVYESVPVVIRRQIEQKKYGDSFIQWMQVLEVDALWQAEPPFKNIEGTRRQNLVRGLLDDAQLAMTLNALLIKNMLSKDITPLINAKYAAMLQEEHVEFYKKFYFDPNRMSRTGWRKYLSSCSVKEKSIYFLALSEDVESLKAELELSCSLNVTGMLQHLLHKSYQKSKAYLEITTPESNREARSWISQTLCLVDKYEKYKTGDKADFAKQLQMEFDYIDDDFPIPDISVLTAMKEEAEKEKPKD